MVSPSPSLAHHRFDPLMELCITPLTNLFIQVLEVKIDHNCPIKRSKLITIFLRKKSIAIIIMSLKYIEQDGKRLFVRNIHDIAQKSYNIQ